MYILHGLSNAYKCICADGDKRDTKHSREVNKQKNKMTWWSTLMQRKVAGKTTTSQGTAVCIVLKLRKLSVKYMWHFLGKGNAREICCHNKIFKEKLRPYQGTF